jgi:hypothetical protein
MFDSMASDRHPIEHKPNVWAGGFDGHYINHTGKPDLAVRVRVRWSDGIESEHDGTTGQWTRSHVYVRLDHLPSMWVLAGDVRRREVTCT